MAMKPLPAGTPVKGITTGFVLAVLGPLRLMLDESP